MPAPFNLFDVANAGSSLSKTLWPGTLTVTMPTSGNVATLLSGANAVGGVLAPYQGWGSVLLDFAGVGAADLTLTVEVGKVMAGSGGNPIATPLASAALKSITTSGTVANVNPYTGASTPATTWRLFDLVTLTNKGQLGQLLANVGGAEDDTPAQLILDVTQADYYYLVVTSLGTLTRAICVATPVPEGLL
jgi:hypothetical protein